MTHKGHGFWWADLRWQMGGMVFVVVALVGSACAAWTLHRVAVNSAELSRKEAQATAQSVAHTLAQQLLRAVRLGIPLAEIPQMNAYLQQTLQHHPSLIAIAVQAEHGQVIYSTGTDMAVRTTVDRAEVPLLWNGRQEGAVWVQAESSHSVQKSLEQARRAAVAVVALAACVAALLAVMVYARPLERQRRAVLLHLQAAAALPEGPSDHGLQFLVDALKYSQAEQDSAQQLLDDYAKELLTVDFDGSMRAEIERVVRQARD